MYAVGREHPLKSPDREFFLAACRDREQLATSAEVLQELTYCYLSINRREILDASLLLIKKVQIQVWIRKVQMYTLPASFMISFPPFQQEAYSDFPEARVSDRWFHH